MKPWAHALGALAGIAVAVGFEAWSSSSYGPRSRAHYAQVENATMTPREVVTQFAHQALEEGQPVQALQRFAAPDYQEHGDLAVPDAGPLVLEHVAVDGDTGMVQFRGPGAGGVRGVDIVRLRDRKILEHWRIVQTR